MENIVLGLEITAFGMGATFLALGVLAGILYLMQVIFAPKSKPVVQSAIDSGSVAECTHSQHVSSPTSQPDDLDLIVVIAAAVAAMMTNDSGETVNHRITSITPLTGTTNTDGLVLASVK